MKKEKFGVLIAGLVILLTINLVFALDLERYIYMTGEEIGSIFAPIFGVGISSEFLFAKVLLFFLLFSIVFVVLKNVDLFRQNRPVLIVVSIVFSVFAIRYLPEAEFIRAILLPYTAGGAALAIFLPLLIYYYFVHHSGIGPFGRKAAWFIYAVFFLVLWNSRFYDPSQDLGSANWIYYLGFGFILVSLIFDKHLHSWFEIGRFNSARRQSIEMKIASLQKAEKDARDTNNTRLADKLERDIKDLAKKL